MPTYDRNDPYAAFGLTMPRPRPRASGTAPWPAGRTSWKRGICGLGYYPILDRAPKGRDERDAVADLDSPP